MKQLIFFSVLLFIFLVSCNDDDRSPKNEKDFFAVANRSSGTVSIIDASTQTLETLIELPVADAAPTYVVHSDKHNLLYISDYATSKVWVYDDESFEYVEDYPIESGGFHMWVNDRVDQLWVNNIISKTTTVIDTNNGEVLQTIPLGVTGIELPVDAAQHDVFIAPNGAFAYVSIISLTGQNYVLQYNTQNFELMNIVTTGLDSHLSGNVRNLFILSQADSTIREHRYQNLEATGKELEIANAHGVTPSGNNGFFVTNFSGREVISYNSANNSIINSSPTIATAGVAHNLAYGYDSEVLALTISGGNTVEFFSVSENSELASMSSLTTGSNPFGITYFKSE